MIDNLHVQLLHVDLEEMEETDAALYEALFLHIVEHVKPVRLNRRPEWNA